MRGVDYRGVDYRGVDYYKAREGSRRVSEAGPVSWRTRFARRGGSWFEPGLGESRWSRVLGLPAIDLRIYIFIKIFRDLRI